MTVMSTGPALSGGGGRQQRWMARTTSLIVLSCSGSAAAGPDSAEQLARLTGFEGFASRFPVQRSAGLLLTPPDLPVQMPCARRKV